MTKIEELLEKQKILTSLSEKMNELEKELTVVMECIKNNRLIHKDVMCKAIEELQSMNELSSVIYDNINFQDSMSENIDVIVNKIAQELAELRLDEKLEKCKRFLNLVTKDAETKVLLETKKTDLQNILDKYSGDRDSDLEAYNKFVEAVLETDTTKLVSYMVELSQEFSNELLGKAIMLKTVYLPDEPISIPLVQKGKSKNMKNAMKEYGLLVCEDVFSDKYYTKISSAEEKKIGVKIFINDMNAKYSAANIAAIKSVEKYSTVTPELIAISAKIPLYEMEVSLEYLQGKGYIREYGIEDIGLFYCISPKGAKVLQAKDVRTFLKLKGHAKMEECATLEDSLSAVLTRIAYTKLLTACLEQLGNVILKVSEIILAECFTIKIVIADEDKGYVFTGAFWQKTDELEEYLSYFKENCADQYYYFVIAGLDIEMAKKTAEYLVDKLQIDALNIMCYSLKESVYINFNTNEQVKFISFFKERCTSNSQEETPNEDILDEYSYVEKIDYDEDKIGEEIIQLTQSILEKEESQEAVEQDFYEKDNMDNVILNAYQMIADGKTYCATTYLRSLKDDTETVSEIYYKLAYAVNEPMMKCSYNSQKIFSLYSVGVDVFTKYLMVAATLRNFFMDHASYDYSIKSLQANVKEISIVSNSSYLTNVLYNLAIFKEETHKGIDYYADYKVKDQVAVENALDSLVMEAKSYYDSYVGGLVRENTSNKRFIETRRRIFSKEGDFAGCLKIVVDKDYELAEIVRTFLKDTFISDGCSIEYINTNVEKLNAFVDEYWEKAGENMLVARKTSNLMSRLRNNLLNAIEKVIRVMCEWISLVEKMNTLKEDDGSKRYKEIKRDLIADMENAITELKAKNVLMKQDERAGSVILEDTLQEMISRLSGSYDEKSYKYYYVDFLRGDNVLLDQWYFPDMRGKFVDFKELSLPNRILKHSKSLLMSFEEKLNYIFFQYGDDYGTAELIITYLKDIGKIINYEEYNIKKSEEKAKEEAWIKFLDFIENLELAQSYGQIEETKENKKEKIQKIVSEWLEYARESKNYGFFNLVLEQYRKKIHEDAKVRGKALSRELDKIKSMGNINDGKWDRIQKIQEMIECQNYTVAEDLLSRIDDDETDESIDIFNNDYLKKFIEEYDYNYNKVANSSRKLSDLISRRIHNKDEKGAWRLVENWMPLSPRKLNVLLDSLGFTGAEVKEQPKLGKIENYFVTIKLPGGRKVNYKHPIAAFGSKAIEDGFRVVCLFGRYSADSLIEEFKNIAGTKNTLILLDYALSLSDRRRLARKVKRDLNDKVFAVLDRVLLMFLVNNYSVQFMNQILMSTMMPFSYYQPYVWDSSKVMPPEIFMGRKYELEKIESPSGVNIVYGGRQLGKSALLKMAKMNIDNDENHNRAVFVEIKGLNYECAARKIGHELYDVGILDKDIDTDDWNELARVIKKRLQNNELPHIPYLLLLLDEADTFIESCELVNFQPFDALKDIQSVGIDRFKFVIAGLHNIVRFKRDVALSNNSVLTHLTSISIKPFNKRDARLLLEEPLYYLGLRFPKDKQSLVSLILANTNYFPGLIQLYCASLIDAMRKDDYAGYDQINTPVYEVNPNHIKKVLSDLHFMNQIREKFEITLKLDEDNMYYIIALLMAYLYHQNANSADESDGFSALDIISAAEEYGVKKVVSQSEEVIEGLMQELLELNIFRQTVNNLYLFSRYSFFQMMGTSNEVDDKLLEYMED